MERGPGCEISAGRFGRIRETEAAREASGRIDAHLTSPHFTPVRPTDTPHGQSARAQEPHHGQDQARRLGDGLQGHGRVGGVRRAIVGDIGDVGAQFIAGLDRDRRRVQLRRGINVSRPVKERRDTRAARRLDVEPGKPGISGRRRQPRDPRRGPEVAQPRVAGGQRVPPAGTGRSWCR